jgi:tetratricopeptide (TPR) repeat protein
VRAQARHQLKQDRFSKVTFEAAERTVDWSAAHKSKLIIVSLIAVVVLAVVFGGWFYISQQDEKASLELGQGVRTLSTSLRPSGTPAQPDFPTFASAQERATQAHKQFQAVIDQYPHTRSAEFAHYFLGLTDEDLGDSASAVRELKPVADGHNGEVASLAKLALASVYRSQQNDKGAIDLYNALIAKPTTTVSKAAAQMELAATYQAEAQVQQARTVYQQIQKENPANTAAGQLAAEKLQSLK